LVGGGGGGGGLGLLAGGGGGGGGRWGEGGSGGVLRGGRRREVAERLSGIIASYRTNEKKRTNLLNRRGEGRREGACIKPCDGVLKKLREEGNGVLDKGGRNCCWRREEGTPQEEVELGRRLSHGPRGHASMDGRRGGKEVVSGGGG